MRRLCAADMTTDWGIRSIARSSKYYQPLNYNYGAVWPFLNSWVTAALYKQQMPLQGYTLLKATAGHTFSHGLGTITEVFSGSRHMWPQEAVSHQGFSTAGVTLPLIRGLLGLEGNALDKTIIFAPQFPADWKKVKIKNYRIGPARFSFEFFREKNRLLIKIDNKQAAGFKIRLAPGISTAREFTSIAINGKPVKINNHQQGQITSAPIEFLAAPEGNKVEMLYTLAPEILPILHKSRLGDKNLGLKLISYLYQDKTIKLQVEGLSGEYYFLPMLNTDLIAGVSGAEIAENKLKIKIPGGERGIFVKHDVKINLK